MARVIQAPITGDEKMMRRPPKDKKKDENKPDPKYIEDIEKDMPFDEKFKKAKPEQLKRMMSCGGKVHKMKSGGRAGDGCCIKGHTRGKMC